MRKTVLVLGLLLSTGGSAHAGVLDAYLVLQGGAGFGEGLAGGGKDQDFFEHASGAQFGFVAGMEVVFLDFYVQHDQYTDGELLGTWTQFMTGFDVEFDIGSGDELSKPKTFGMFGVDLGFGVGTLEQVDLPLDNAQVSDKGFVGQVVVGGGYAFNEYFQAVLTIPVAYGYITKNDDISDDANRYHSFHASVLAGLRMQYSLY